MKWNQRTLPKKENKKGRMEEKKSKQQDFDSGIPLDHWIKVIMG